MLAWPGLRMPDLLPSPPQRNPHTNLLSLHHPMVGSNAATERSSWPHNLPEPPLSPDSAESSDSEKNGSLLLVHPLFSSAWASQSYCCPWPWPSPCPCPCPCPCLCPCPCPSVAYSSFFLSVGDVGAALGLEVGGWSPVLGFLFGSSPWTSPPLLPPPPKSALAKEAS